MNIIFYTSGYDGCGYYRVELPAKYMNKIKGVHAKIRTAYNKEDIDWCDLIVLQKQVNDKVLPYVEYAKSKGKKIVTEVDDDYFNIPSWNPAHKYYHDKADDLSRFYKMSDALTVTTDHLAKQLSKYNGNTCVLPNYLDFDMYDRELAGLSDELRYAHTKYLSSDRVSLDTKEVEDSLKDKIVIGWGGSPTHLKDVDLCTDALLKITEEFDNVAVVMMACATEKVISEIPKDRLYLVAPVPIFMYHKVLHTMKFDITICPVVDNVFNKSKSNLKFIEFSSVGFPSICSDVENYSKTVDDRNTGLLSSNDTDSWYSSLYEMVTNDPLRKKLGDNSKSFVRDNYDMKDHYSKWIDLYENVLSNSGV